MRSVVQTNLAKLFNVADLDSFQIAPFTGAGKDTPPGFYKRGDKTFYFSFFNKQHNSRTMDWMLLHEAVPGHHYQYRVQDMSTLRPAFANLDRQFGFTEGWATYVETLGSELGLYKNELSSLGRAEWDLVRSIRLVIDVGIHVEGWTKVKALAFWKEHVPKQDHIAEREIDRIIRWPAQVISYKTGELAIVDLERLVRSCQKEKFDRRRFHQLLLERGDTPFSVLNLILEQDLVRQGCHKS
jgi:uncharacterized protein (DUF885 family)